MVWTGLNAAIGSWGISAISLPRIARISGRAGGEPGQVDRSAALAAGGTGSRRRRSGPAFRRAQDRPHRTLLPQPLSPTMPTTWPGVDVEADAVDRLDRALVQREEGCRSRTAAASGSSRVRRPQCVGVGGVAQAVAQEVQRQHGDDHDQARDEQPGCQCERWMFCASCSSTPQLIAGGRRPRPRKLRDVSSMIITGMASVIAAMMWLQERGQHVAKDDPHPAAAGKVGGQHEILLAQRQEAAAHLAAERGPADQRQDHGDREEDLDRRPVAGQGGGQGEPDRDRRDRLQKLDQALDDHVGEPPK